MKQLKRKIFAFLVAACLICMNIVPAFADTTTDATAPAAADVRQEAQLTASYRRILWSFKRPVPCNPFRI